MRGMEGLNRERRFKKEEKYLNQLKHSN